MGARWARLRALDAERPWLLDSVLAALLFAGAVLSSVLGATAREPDAGYVALVAVGAAPYALRRRAPVAVLLAASVPVVALLALGYSSAVIGSGLFLAAYSVAAWSGLRATVAAAGYVVVVLTSVAVVGRLGFGELATNVALFAGAFALGRAIDDRRRTAALLADRAELAERARVEEARRAVADERLHIAQELHDVIGHTLGVIAVQSQVGARVIDADPAEAKQCLVSVSERSRGALAEIRRILAGLRTDDAPGYAPPPGLDALADLAADVTAAGVPVDLRVEDAESVPAALGLTAYRVVQESLTNVLKHAGPAHAAVTLRREHGALLVEITDDGRGVRGTEVAEGRPRDGHRDGHSGGHGDGGSGVHSGGHGQLGMAERVAVWGGTLTTGPRPDGGYRVAARLPLGGDA